MSRCQSLWSITLPFLIVFVFQAVPARAAGVNRVWYNQQGDGTVLQTIQMQAPTQVYRLDFRYCDGLTCGNPQDPELDCYVNKYNPQFVLPPRSLVITPPPGSSVKKVFLKAGSLPGFTGSYGYWDPYNQSGWNSSILSDAPSVGSNGSLTFNFKQPNFMGAFSRAPSGRVCGLSEEEYRAFGKTYGTTSDDNFYQSYFKLGIVWSPPTSGGLVNTMINLDGQKQENQWVYLASRSPTPLAVPKTDPNQPYLGDIFGKTGTIPTVVAGILARLGQSVNPVDLAHALEKAGVASEKGIVWDGLKNYLASQQQPTFTARDITAADALRGASSGVTYLTTFTTETKTGRVETTVFLTGFEAARDRVEFLTTEGQRLKVDTELYLRGQPWIMDIRPNQ